MRNVIASSIPGNDIEFRKGRFCTARREESSLHVHMCSEEHDWNYDNLLTHTPDCQPCISRALLYHQRGKCQETAASKTHYRVRGSQYAKKLALSALCASLYTVSWLAVFSILIWIPSSQARHLCPQACSYLSAAIFAEARLTSTDQPD